MRLDVYSSRFATSHRSLYVTIVLLYFNFTTMRKKMVLLELYEIRFDCNSGLL